MSLYVKIKKDFGTFLLDAEFEAQAGVLGLLGASGCGKSMTLKCIAGVISPDSGLVISDGRVLFDSAKKINLPPQRRNVGLLFQNYALFPNMTVRQNILSVLPCVHKKNNPNDILLSLAKKFHFEGLESHYPANLSGGQQQRVALARIMASEPSIMMLDEPLSALDSYLRWQLEGELVQILEEFGGVTLYVSHNRDEVYRLCEKVCVMNSGKTEPVRTVGELFDSPDTLASALLSGCKNYSRVERVGERRIYALDWNTEFECKKNVAEDITFIGVRAHYIHLSGGGDQENVISCRVLRVTQDVFNTVINLVPGGAPPERNFSRIRMELSKESAVGINIGDTVSVHVKPEDVMLLKK